MRSALKRPISAQQHNRRTRIGRAVTEMLESRRLLSTITVTNANSFGAGSLRDAINLANAQAGADLITFNISPGGPVLIKPNIDALPTITGSDTTVDGTNLFPGSFFDRRVILDGSLFPSTAPSGLSLDGARMHVKHLHLQNWGGNGLRMNNGFGLFSTIDDVLANNNGSIGASAFEIDNSTQVQVTNCVARNNGGDGFYLNGSDSCFMSLCTADSNAGAGFELAGSSDTNTIDSCTAINSGGAGVKLDGNGFGGNWNHGNTVTRCVVGWQNVPGRTLVSAPNHTGILIQGKSNNNIIGGSISERNYIAGNVGTGVSVTGDATDANTIQNNYIGVTSTGSALANTGDGIFVNINSGTQIVSNLVSGNSGNGMIIRGSNLTSIRGNRVGTNETTTAAMPNGFSGIAIDGGSIFNTINGGNIVSGNTFAGVFLVGNNTSENIVAGNTIGLSSVSGTAIPNDTGITIGTGAFNNTIGGLAQADVNVISGNTNYGLLIGTPGANNRVLGNLIGNISGNIARPNGVAGVYVSGAAPGTIIGSTTSGRNYISGNGQDGIRLNGASGVSIIGNFIGVGDGGQSLGNSGNGIAINSSSGNVIGGPGSGARNIITRNGGDGIRIDGSSSANIQNNSVIANAGYGVAMTNGAFNNIIGGDISAGLGNTISGNALDGVFLGNATHNNSVWGNLIGLGDDGVTRFGNGFKGVGIFFGASQNEIGGGVADRRNVISANTTEGVSINSSGSTGNRIHGNYIGTNAGGTASAGNGFEGIAINAGAIANQIGGSTPADGNVVSGNRNGILLGSSSNVVLYNRIGTDVTGVSPLPNLNAGILLVEGAQSNMIGDVGSSAGSGNMIAFNGSQGILVNAGTNNVIRGNSISQNVLLGIDLAPVGDTPNDPGDGDSGPNNLQNKPILTNVADNGDGTFTIAGTINTTSNSTVRIDCYSTPFAATAGTTEGESYIGGLNVQTDSAGNATFSLPVSAPVALVTATATLNNNTSEFSDSVGTAAGLRSANAPYSVVDNGDSTQTLSLGNGTFDFNRNPSQTIGANLIVDVNPSNTGASNVYFNTFVQLNQIFVHNGGFVSLNPHPLPPRVLMRAGGVTVFNGGRMMLGAPAGRSSGSVDARTPTGDSLIIVNTVNVQNNGVLDLNDSDMIVDYTGGSPRAAIQSLINSARAGGAWTGNGITSYNAFIANPKNTTLGVMEATEFKSIYGPSALFNGQSIDTTCVLVKYTYYGDADFNGVVNFDDYSRTDAGFNFGRTGWLNGDYDGNGVINFDDYSLIDLAFNTQGAALRPSVTMRLPAGKDSRSPGLASRSV